MALRKQLVGIPLAKGLNTKVHDRILPAGELTTLDNAHATKAGEVQKRKGFQELSNDIPPISTGDTASTIDNGKAIATFGKEILAFDGRYGYSKTSTSDNWVNKGRVVGCALEGKLVSADSNLIQTPSQIGQANNIEVHAWSEVDPASTYEGTNVFTGSSPDAGLIIVDNPVFNGSGQSTMTTGGTYSLTTFKKFRVVINDDYPTPNTFDWSYDVGSGWVTGASSVNITGSAQTLANGVTVTFGSTSGYTKGEFWDFNAGQRNFELTGFSDDHNYEVGSVVSINFTDADWVDGDYTCIQVDAPDAAIFDYGKACPDSGSGGTTIITNGESWKTYTKILDKATGAEISGKTLINTFSTGTSVHNVPRVQVATQGDYIVVFVHVGSGRVKHIGYDTSSGLNTSFTSTELVNTPGLDVTFSVDINFPHWHVQSTNYVDGSATDGLVVLRREDGGGGQVLRLSYYDVTESGGVISVSEVGTPSPVVITESVFFRTVRWNANSFATETYVLGEADGTANIKLYGSLMLSVVRNPTSGYDEHIVVGYTKAINATNAGSFSPVGTADEPGGVRVLTYDAQFTDKNDATLTVDGVTSAFTAGTVDGSDSGYVLVQGTAARTTAMVTSGHIRAFVTLIKNVTRARNRPQSHRVSAYDLPIDNSDTSTDMNMDLHECALSSAPFNYGDDFYLQLSYGTRPNSIGGGGNFDVFNNSVDMLINQEGLVFAKGPSSAGSVSLDMNNRFLENAISSSSDPTNAIQKRINLLQSLPRPIQVSTGGSLFKWGSSRYNGVAINADGTDITAMLASVSSAEMNPKRYLPSVEVNGSLAIASGILWEYSGDYFKENNFFYWPEIKRSEAAPLSGGLEKGKYSYVAIYEWVSSDGRVERSHPSAPMEIDTSGSSYVGDQKHTLYVYTLQLTHRQDLAGSSSVKLPSGVAAKQWGSRSLAKIVLFRTEAGKARYHRCAEQVMDPLVGVQAIEDTLPDADASLGGLGGLVDNPDIYTFGGAVPNLAPPSCRDLAVWKKRLWLVTSENSIWYSKRFERAVGTSLSGDFYVPSDNGSEQLNAISPLTEALLVLGEDNGYYLQGEGPLDTGLGGGFSPLKVFAPGSEMIDGGCRVETPVGVFFQTRQGLMNVDPTMKLTYKGAKAEGYFSVDNPLVDGIVLESESEIRFTAYDSGGILVYNYLFDLWSAFSLHADLGNNAASITQEGVHYRLGVNGTLYKQHATDCNDITGGVNKPYAFGFITGWINIGKLQQVGRVYRIQILGDFNSESSAKLYFYKDYSETATLISTTTAPGVGAKQLVCKLPVQKLKALKFGITETTPTTGGDFRVQAASLLVGIKKPETSFKQVASSQIQTIETGH